MKKMKFLIASVLFCAVSYVGYTTYKQMAMSDAEKFMQANVVALTQDEIGAGHVAKYCHAKNSDEQKGCFANNTGAHCHKHSDCSNV